MSMMGGDTPRSAPDTVEKCIKKINMLRDTNSRIINEIESLGGGVDIATARVEHFFGYLQSIGVLTELQRYQEQYMWELDLKSQIAPVVQRMRNNPPSRTRLN